MSTKIGIIAEGPIDHALLPALLTRIAAERAAITWPVNAQDIAELFLSAGAVMGACWQLSRPW